jgi:hypothetical protein
VLCGLFKRKEKEFARFELPAEMTMEVISWDATPYSQVDITGSCLGGPDVWMWIYYPK